LAKVYKSSVIEAPVDQVWAHIRDFNGLHKWFPGVTDTRLEGSIPAGQAGCVRNFGLPGGGRMREELLEFSDQDHTCVYKMLDGAVPMSRYQAGVRLRPVTDAGSTFAELSAEFECAPGQENDVAAFLGSTYQTAFDGLKHHFKKP
jgi:polyketide cyclase/dehydrase/lipid transport protein